MGDSTDEVAVVGAGVVGCAVAWALTKARRRVLLIDREEPAKAGASFGNAGHVATEQVQPLPSPRLLLSFWRELSHFGGPLDLPLRRAGVMAPWVARFAQAAFQQARHTQYLAPLARSAADTLESYLGEVGKADLLRRNGHYVLWLGSKAAARAAAEHEKSAALGVAAKDAPAELLRIASQQTRSKTAAGLATAAGLWFPDSAHVLDPALVARAFAAAAVTAGGSFLRTTVRHLHPAGDLIELATDSGPLRVRTAVVCAGAWSAPLLAPFGIRAPLEAERGYHVELPGHASLVDAPVVYADHNVVVTPMASRLRATSFLEFAGLDAPADPRKPARLRSTLRSLGYQCDPDGPSWMGPRPTLPDYLPGIGRARGPHELFYAVGHQHLGLTLAAVTADLVANMLTGRTPRFDVRPFDLGRFSLC